MVVEEFRGRVRGVAKVARHPARTVIVKHSQSGKGPLPKVVVSMIYLFYVAGYVAF